MAKFKKIGNAESGMHYFFNCPGCNDPHGIDKRWTFNGDLDNPTVSPSLKVTYPANPDAEERFKEWRQERVCHSFIKNGKIQFLNDCWHHLKGQTVELPEIT